MPRYNTRQRGQLLNFLSLHKDEQLSAKEIARALSSSEISLSAVYRNLTALENDGKVRHYIKSGSRESFYQFIDDNSCKGHLHLSCESCGKTFHMDCENSEELADKIADKEAFCINRSNTILYGICKDCRK